MLLDRIPVRLRLSLGHALWMALLFGGIGWGVYKVVERDLYQSVDAALLTSANTIRDARTMRNFGSPLMQEFLEDILGERFIRSYAQLVDLSGRVSMKSQNMRANLPVSPESISKAERGEHNFETFRRSGYTPLRQVTIPVLSRGRFTGELIQVGAPLDSTLQTLRSISLMLWIALPVGLLFSIIFGYLLTARSLRPVKRISQTASQLGVDDLSVRMALPRARDEIRVLTHTFNEMLDRLEDAFGRLRRFAGDVSHELRTPLSVLRGEAELTLRRERSPEEYRTALQVIAKEASNMTDIVEDLLLLARAQGKALEVEWEQLDPTSLMMEVKGSVQLAFEQRKVSLRMDIKESLGTFKGSANFLSLTLKNILINAAKHSQPGSVVDFSASKDQEHIRFIVRDYGEGIPKDSLPYIFDPFYRADTARNRAAGGSGVGLSLAKALVQLHHGELIANSIEGQGATFEVVLPIDPEADRNKRCSHKVAVVPSRSSLIQDPAENFI